MSIEPKTQLITPEGWTQTLKPLFERSESLGRAIGEFAGQTMTKRQELIKVAADEQAALEQTCEQDLNALDAKGEAITEQARRSNRVRRSFIEDVKESCKQRATRARNDELSKLTGGEDDPDGDSVSNLARRVQAIRDRARDLGKSHNETVAILDGLVRGKSLPKVDGLGKLDLPPATGTEPEDKLKVLELAVSHFSADVQKARRMAGGFGTSIWSWLVIHLVLLGGAGGYGYHVFIQNQDKMAKAVIAVLPVVIGYGVLLVIAILLAGRMRSRMPRALAPLPERGKLLAEEIVSITRQGSSKMGGGGIIAKSVTALIRAGEVREATGRGVEQRYKKAVERIDKRATALKNRFERFITKRRDSALEQLKERKAERQRMLDTQRQELAAEHERREQVAMAERDQEFAGLKKEFAALVASISDAATGPLPAGQVELSKAVLPWIGVAQHHGWPMEHVADSIPQGDLALPIGLGFPLGGDLMVVDDDAMAAAGSLVQGAVRAMEAHPAGQIRLTVVDPIGLGAGFSALGQLTDEDDRLMGAKIWTGPQEVDERLKKLCDRIELVIQKYLRTRFKDLGEFNAQAGELAEPYHILIIGDHPKGLSDTGQELLSKILDKGPRCGVQTWLHRKFGTHSAGKRSGYQIRVEGGQRKITIAGIESFIVDEGTPLSLEQIEERLKIIGDKARNTRRVAISLTDAMANRQAWAGNTDKLLSIPIGRCGVEREQDLVIGEGTCQHVLIGGRTGSGKSTLLHVLIAAGLWNFGPDELDFYLIDFKKGVEFKTYADNPVPNIRVVAIESDRDFGLSVLKHIDSELDRRGEAFRAAGVQDLAAFRAKGNKLPRSLLVIDEFHEFFTDDDAISRDAAMLLDRFVRQGRAFGVHIILGSQTLGGFFSLARTTMGQMGVRIALQCSEADSQLILDENNPAARNLERPGEGVYNDRSGLLEGNSLFQTYWIGDEDREQMLNTLGEKAGPEANRPFVFEGNAPAVPGSTAELIALRDGKGPGKSSEIYLGAPSAIAGSVSLDLQRGHTLIVGQNREAATGIMATALTALALRHKGDGAKFVWVDGTTVDDRTNERLGELFGQLGGSITRAQGADIETAITGISAGTAAEPTYLFLNDFGHCPQLKPDDPFASPGDSGGGMAGMKFGDFVTNGLSDHIHIVAWIDAPTAVNRMLTRNQMRLFSHRILFQMSAGDSADLTDETMAVDLGLHHALLHRVDEGKNERFRPFVFPAQSFLG